MQDFIASDGPGEESTASLLRRLDNYRQSLLYLLEPDRPVFRVLIAGLERTLAEREEVARRARSRPLSSAAR
jgi:hypothetical protein